MTLEEKYKKRLDIYEKLSIKSNIQLIDKIIEHPLSSYLEKTNYINGQDNIISKQINKIYCDIIANDDDAVIINAIKNFDDSGIGKGEMLLSFLFDDVSFNGGSVNYDINSDNGKYEVKCYGKLTTPIRLGTEGNITRFNNYLKLLELFSQLDGIKTNDNVNKHIKHIWKRYAVDNITKSKFTIKSGVSSGEISKNCAIAINDLLRYLDKIKNEFYNLNYNTIVFNKSEYIINIDNIDISNKTITCNTITNVKDNHEINDLAKLSDIVNYIKNIDVVHLFDDFCDEAIEAINSNFKIHPMIIINSNNSYPLCLGVFDEFEYHHVTQGSVRIIPKQN